MSVEWDEELVAEWEGFFHECGDAECQDKQKIVRLARSEHTARLEAEAERDALAKKVAAARRVLELRDVCWFESLAAILSDQEGL